jgi:pimeloyl-ACP methyl ester carboxylesterase
MLRILVGVLGALALAWPAAAQVTPFPGDFRTQAIATADGATIHVRSGGQGPAVVLIHGFGDTGDMWAPLATVLARAHTVVVPDLRGLGLSSQPAGGYDKRTQAADVRAVLIALGLDRAAIVGHDIGTMVAYAYAARYRDKTEKLVVMDAPVPGIPPWDDIVRNPLLWHFSFGGPDAERLVAGRERIYLDRFWNEFAGDPTKIDEATREHYAALYARPGAMRAAFAQFRSFPTDAADNQVSMAAPLLVPVLAVGGEKSFGAMEALVMRHAATDVREAVVAGAGHWLMEEQPAATISLIARFLEPDERRVTPGEFSFPEGAGAGTGTSGVAGIQTIVLKGDPDSAGLYTIMLRVPAQTRIAPHDHQDVSGTWYIGYGDAFAPAALKALPPGSFYTEPAHRTHFAETRDEPVIMQITGMGPSSTRYVDPASDPRRGSGSP